MWSHISDRSPIIAITNAQQKKYWADREMEQAFQEGNQHEIRQIKREMKTELF